MHQITGKTIIITGATAGVGRALATSLMDHNRLILIGRNKAKLAWFEGRRAAIETRLLDLSDISAVRRTAANIACHHASIDILINNAAVQHETTFTHPSFNPDTIAEETTINFTSICYLIHGLLPAFVHGQAGQILNINSALALTPKTSSAVYCATKAALRSLSQSLRYQLEDTDIKVMEAYLPLVDTAMTAGRALDKISAEEAAKAILAGLHNGKQANFIGKTRLLRLIHRLSPALAARILKPV